MAIAFTRWASGVQDVPAASITSASFTPSAGSVVFVHADTTIDTGTKAWAISDTLGSTWTQVASLDGLTWDHGTYWWALAGTGARTVTVSGSTGNCYHGFQIFDVTGIDTTTPIVQNASGTAPGVDGSPKAISVTLASAITSGNPIVFLAGNQNDQAGAFATATCNSVNMSEINNDTAIYSHTASWYSTSPGSTTATCSDIGLQPYGGVGFLLELNAVASGIPTFFVGRRPTYIFTRR